MITVRRYTAQNKQIWDNFVLKAKNGLFIFRRSYMDYHRSRFTDHSLLFYNKETLLAILPANIENHVLYTHQGLTFGGILTDSHMTTARMLAVFEVLRSYCRRRHIRFVVYKAIPSVYHQLPAQEDLYALYRYHARLIGRDIASVVDQTCPVPYHANTMRLLKTTKRGGLLTIRENKNYPAFMEIVSSLLAKKYHAKPTHTTAEITALAANFPKEIRLFTSYEKTEPLGGIIIYEYPTVAHCQYIAASDRGKKLGALSPLFDRLITRVFARKRYFSFGKSTENEGTYLNEGLIRNKEHYGGRE